MKCSFFIKFWLIAVLLESELAEKSILFPACNKEQVTRLYPTFLVTPGVCKSRIFIFLFDLISDFSVFEDKLFYEKIF